MARQETKQEPVLMQVTKQGGFGNTTIIGNVTMRRAGTLALIILVGFGLWRTPLFEYNWFAMIAYIAFSSLCLGQTPTGRNILTNLYGVLFKRNLNMVVSEDMSVTTIGHGIREVILNNPDVDVPIFHMVGTKNYTLVYNVTSGINRWSSEEDKIIQARRVKSLFNIFEGGEGLIIVEKQDNDTGMLKLREILKERESFVGDDLQKMSDKRSKLLWNTGTSEHGRSIQQYAVLQVKPKNLNRTLKELRKISRIVRPATNPVDVLFAMMGFEGGVEWTSEYSKANVLNGDNASKQAVIEAENDMTATSTTATKKKATSKSTSSLLDRCAPILDRCNDMIDRLQEKLPQKTDSKHKKAKKKGGRKR